MAGGMGYEISPGEYAASGNYGAPINFGAIGKHESDVVRVATMAAVALVVVAVVLGRRGGKKR